MEATPLTPTPPHPQGAPPDVAPPDVARADAALSGVSPENAAEPIAEPDVLGRLRSEPYSFEFFQAVNLLERLWSDRAPVGEFSDPGEEIVRFRSATSVAFPASEIQAFDPPRDGVGPARMTVNFMGLTGPLGQLPLAYSLYAAERARARDHTLKDFFGIFEHRFISLLYRAWERGRASVSHGSERDWMTRHLLDLVGLGTNGLQDKLPVPDASLLFYAGLLGIQSRPAGALEQLIEDYFGVAAEVEQFVGAWYPLERETQCALDDGSSGSNQLGLGAVAGDELWDTQSRVRVRLGPLSRSQYNQFLPGGTAHDRLRAITRFFGNDQVDFEIQLVLARDDVPPCVLGHEDTEPMPLGWCTWLRTVPFVDDAADTTFSLSDARAST